MQRNDFTPKQAPKEIHAIWLGGLLREAGRNNLANWAKLNPGYKTNLWIDSSLFYMQESNFIHQYEEFKQWAKDNNITICDVALKPEKSDDNVKGKSDIYEHMLNKIYYDDEINGVYQNFAAASDNLRVEILYALGGIYIDAEDILPNQSLPEKLSLPCGFLCNMSSGYGNDILVSIPKGSIISQYRQAINTNYQALYKDKARLYAHRNSEYSSKNLYNGKNPRFQSTVDISGPAAMAEGALKPLTKSKIRFEDIENNADIDVTANILFSPKYFQRFDKFQANSWFDGQESSKLEKVEPMLRNYCRVFYTDQIDIEMKKIEERIANKSVAPKSDAIINYQKEALRLLSVLKLKLNALPPTSKMLDVYQSCINEFTKKEIGMINAYSGDILINLERNSRVMEEIIDLAGNGNTHLNATEIFAYLKTKDFSQFVSSVLNPYSKGENDDLQKILADGGIHLTDTLTGYDLAVMQKDVEHGNLQKHVIEFNATDEGLAYRVLGISNLRFGLLEEKGVIQWDQLSSDFPRENNEILKNKDVLLPQILEKTAKIGHTTQAAQAPRRSNSSTFFQPAEKADSKKHEEVKSSKLKI